MTTVLCSSLFVDDPFLMPEIVSAHCIDLELEECMCHKHGARAQVSTRLRNERPGWLFAVLADTRHTSLSSYSPVSLLESSNFES